MQRIRTWPFWGAARLLWLLASVQEGGAVARWDGRQLGPSTAPR
jgi:hypothetical protein